jgi:hypothetical protein
LYQKREIRVLLRSKTGWQKQESILIVRFAILNDEDSMLNLEQAMLIYEETMLFSEDSILIPRFAGLPKERARLNVSQSEAFTPEQTEIFPDQY